MADSLTSPSKVGHGRIYGSITETIGNTPLVRLNRLTKEHGVDAEILLKLEFFNPIASVKDRIGVNMIDALEASGKLKPGGTLVEPTSGNTGIALAFHRRRPGLPADPRHAGDDVDRAAQDARLPRRRAGADPGPQGMKGAIAKAEELLREIPGSVMPQQFSNPANPDIHRRTTAEEIWTDTGGQLDAFVAGVGTGGTVTGVAEVLKPRLSGLKVFAVEPVDSPVISGGQPGPHKIQGIGAGFIPDNLHTDVLDGVLKVSNETAIETSRALAKLEGIPGGISTGGNVAAALELAKRPEFQGKRIVTIACSFAERYISSVLFEGIG